MSHRCFDVSARLRLGQILPRQPLQGEISTAEHCGGNFQTRSDPELAAEIQVEGGLRQRLGVRVHRRGDAGAAR